MLRRLTDHRPRSTRKTALVTALLALPACRPSGQPAVVPLAIVPSATMAPDRVPAGEPIVVSYKWAVHGLLPPLLERHRAFVHFVDAEGALLFTDDHPLSPPLDAWQPGGRSYEYRRIVLTPTFPYVGAVTVLMGLYGETTGERLALQGDQWGRRAYQAGRFTMLPRRRDLTLTCDGLFPSEASIDSPLVITRFMPHHAICRFPNPREDVILLVHGDIEPEGFPSPPVLTVSAARSFAADLPLTLMSEPQLLRVRLPAASLGRAPVSELRLSMSHTYVPRSLGVGDDPRELSLRVRGLSVGLAKELDPLLIDGASEARRPQ